MKTTDIAFLQRTLTAFTNQTVRNHFENNVSYDSGDIIKCLRINEKSEETVMFCDLFSIHSVTWYLKPFLHEECDYLFDNPKMNEYKKAALSGEYFYFEIRDGKIFYQLHKEYYAK